MVTSTSAHVVQRRLCRRLCARERVFRRSVAYATFLLLSAFLTLLDGVDAIRCTYPSSTAVFQPGTRQKISWQVDPGDLGTTTTLISGYVYCMDLAGPQGGIWRLQDTLFDLQSLQFGSSFTFEIPECGVTYGGGDGLVRLVSWRFDSWGFGTQEAQCRYRVLDAEPAPRPVMSTNTPPPQLKSTDKNLLPQPTTSVALPATARLPQTKSVQPPASPSSPPGGTSSNAQSPGSTSSPTSPVGGSSGIPQVNGLGPNTGPVQTTVDLPPLPALPTMPPGIGHEDDERRRQKLIQSLVGGLTSLGIVIVVVALVLRHRRRRSPRVLGASGSSPSTENLRSMAARLRGKSGSDGQFHKMEDNDDDEERRDGLGDQEKKGTTVGLAKVPSDGSKKSKKSNKTDPEKEDLKRRSNSVRIPVNLMDMDVDPNVRVHSMQVPLTPTSAAFGAGTGPSLLKPPEQAHVGSSIVLGDEQRWTILMMTGHRHSYTSSRDDYSFMQQGYLDDFAEEEASVQAALRPGEPARRDSQMTQPLASEIGDLSIPRGDQSEVGGPDFGDMEDVSSAVQKYWAASAAARSELVRGNHRVTAQGGDIDVISSSVKMQKTTAAATVGSNTSRSSSDVSHMTALPISPSPAMLEEKMLREDWDETESKMANQGSRVGTLTTHRTGTPSSHRLSETGITNEDDRPSVLGSRRASSLVANDIQRLHHQWVPLPMHPLYQQYRQSHPSDGMVSAPVAAAAVHRRLDGTPLQHRQRLGRSASVSSSFTLSSFGSTSRNDTRLYSYTQGLDHLHPHYYQHSSQHYQHHPEHIHSAYYYYQPEDPFQDSASAYAYSLDDNGFEYSSSQAPSHLSITSSSVDSSAVLAADPFKTFDSNNIIEEPCQR